MAVDWTVELEDEDPSFACAPKLECSKQLRI